MGRVKSNEFSFLFFFLRIERTKKKEKCSVSFLSYVGVICPLCAQDIFPRRREMKVSLTFYTFDQLPPRNLCPSYPCYSGETQSTTFGPS